MIAIDNYGGEVDFEKGKHKIASEPIEIDCVNSQKSTTIFLELSDTEIKEISESKQIMMSFIPVLIDGIAVIPFITVYK